MAVFVEVAERGSFADGCAAARALAGRGHPRGRPSSRRGSGCGSSTAPRARSSLTEAGERFLAGARRVLADLDEIERAAAGEGTAPRGELRLTAPILFGRLHVTADRDRVSGSFSRRVGGAHAARSAGRSGGGGPRRGGAHRRAGGKLGGRDPRRRGASHRRRRPGLSGATWHAAHARGSRCARDNRILRHLGRRALGVRRRGRRNERCYKAAAGRDHGGGRGRRGESRLWRLPAC